VSGVRAGVVGALLLIALVLDAYVLLPGFEAGRGGMPEGAKVMIWLLVNSPPALVTGHFTRAAGHGAAAAIAAARGVALLTCVGLVVVVAAYAGPYLD
jgi:hypothetical protein